jgi:ADP-heptose:LPS heptosyltransferase
VPVSRGIREENGSTESKAALDAFFSAMREERFDVALQMHGGGRYSNPFVLNLHARLTAGFRTPDAAPLDINVRYIYFQPEILRYLEVVGLIGAKAVTLEPRVSVTERDLAESLSVVDEGLKPLVVLVPGAGDGRRRWPPEKFAALADRLADAGARVVVSGDVSDRPVVDAIVRLAGSRSLEVCNTLSLGGLAGLLARCALVVGNDSGPLQLANAVGTATVGIYWCGNLITAGPITRRRHRPLLSWRLECPVCGVNCIYGTCDHRQSFVADVTVDEVWEQAADLLAQYR